jgi:hypothetical protein
MNATMKMISVTRNASFCFTFPPEKVADTNIFSWSKFKVEEIGSIFIDSLHVT